MEGLATLVAIENERIVQNAFVVWRIRVNQHEPVSYCASVHVQSWHQAN